MVKVDVLLFGALARVAGRKEVAVEASTLIEALEALSEEFGEEFNRRLFDDGGKPRRFINVYVNGRDMRFLDRLETELKGGDAVSVIPAVSGG